ncbi:MAG: serine/threonine-protein kinase [Planctomycetota bacterium]
MNRQAPAPPAPNPACLTPAEIHQLLDNALPDHVLLVAENHLSNCHSCQLALHTASGGPLLLAEVGHAIREAEQFPDSLRPATPDAPNPDPFTPTALLALLGPTDDPQMLGRIGPWEISGLVGIGGMGAVFKAFDPALNRFVAVKILLPHLAATPTAHARFLREAQAAAAVVNEHVLPIHAIDEFRGIPYLVSQYVRGGTLQQFIALHGALPLPEILRIALHVTKALAAAHQLGIIHRDVKPSNILLDASGHRAWLADFGLARAADDLPITRSGQLAGTPQFMSPEQIHAAQLDPRSDLFSLGCVLWTMAAGVPPFHADSPWTSMRRIVDQPTPELPPSRSPPPHWLQHLIRLLMAKRPEQRPQSAALVAELLQQCLRHLEHPQTNPVPALLCHPPTVLSNSRIRSLLMTCLAASVALLVTCFAPSPSNSPATPAPATPMVTAPPAIAIATAPAPAAPDDMTGVNFVAGHKIEIIGSANVKNLDSVPVLRRDLAFPMFGDTNIQQFADNATFNFPAGNGGFGQVGGGGGGAVGGAVAAGGGGGGFAGGGGLNGAGGEPVSPNFGIALKITPEKAAGKRKTRLIIDIEPGATLVEHDGQTVQAPTGAMQISCPEFEQQFPDARFIYAERRQNPNRTLKEIRGTLKIQPGRELKAVFQNAKPGKQKVDGEEFQLQKVEQTAAGLSITVAFPPTTLAKKARTIPDRMQATMQASFAMQASIEDSSGQFHEAKSGGSGGGASGGVSSFSFNGVPQGQKNFQPPVQPPVQPTVMTFQFSPLKKDRTVKNVILHMADIEGQPELLPFTIVTLPAAPGKP